MDNLLCSPLWAASYPVKQQSLIPAPTSFSSLVGGGCITLVLPSGTYGGESKTGEEEGCGGEGERVGSGEETARGKEAGIEEGWKP